LLGTKSSAATASSANKPAIPQNNHLALENTRRKCQNMVVIRSGRQGCVRDLLPREWIFRT
jgi:hypothetical protein